MIFLKISSEIISSSDILKLTEYMWLILSIGDSEYLKKSTPYQFIFNFMKTYLTQ
jgi:hypothetical protein